MSFRLNLSLHPLVLQRSLTGESGFKMEMRVRDIVAQSSSPEEQCLPDVGTSSFCLLGLPQVTFWTVFC